MKLRDTEFYRQNVRIVNNLIWRESERLSERENTKVSAYNKGENVRQLARMLNLVSILGEMNAIGDMEQNDELQAKLAKIQKKCGDFTTKRDRADAERIFSQMARDPEKKGQAINQDILYKAYGSYHRNPSNFANASNPEEEINTVGKFDSFIQKLKDSRTKRNSREYENIIKAAEIVNRTDTFESGKYIDRDQQYAVKLLAIKNSINDYIAHKAKSGVNKNIGDKLEAVEALNREVSARLSKLDVDPFKINGKKVDFANYPITLEQEIDAAKKVNPKGEFPSKAFVEDLNEGCMRRIIAKAVEKNYSKSHIKSLERIREEFYNSDLPKLDSGSELHL